MAVRKKKPFAYNPEFSNEETAILQLNTNYINYHFIILFNKLYNLNLVRVEDVEIDNYRYCCYSFYDTLKELMWVMIERPLNDPDHPIFLLGEKMLLISGPDSWREQQTIYDDFYEYLQKPADGEYLDLERYQNLKQFKEEIFGIEKISFSSIRGKSISSHPGPIETLKPAMQRYMKGVEKFVGKLYDNLQYHLMEGNTT